MRRVIGMDIHRTFAEVVVWEDGRLRPHGRVDVTRSGLEGFGRGSCRVSGWWAWAYPTKLATRVPSRALPRRRALWTSWKRPR